MEECRQGVIGDKLVLRPRFREPGRAAFFIEDFVFIVGCDSLSVSAMLEQDLWPPLSAPFALIRGHF